MASSTREERQLELEYFLQFQPQFLDFLKKLIELGIDKNHHIRIPFCIDKLKKAKGIKIKEVPDQSKKAGGFTQQQFKQFVDFLENTGIRYTIYLAPNDAEAYEEFQKMHQDVINKIKFNDADLDLKNEDIIPEKELEERKIILITKWRKSSMWLSAADDYEDLRNGEKKLKTSESLSKSVDNYCDNHPEADKGETESHLILETKDYVSWLKKKGDMIDNSLLYPHSRPQVLQNADANAGLMNRIPKSLPHFKYYFANPTANIKHEKSPSYQQKEKTSTKHINNVLQCSVPSPDVFVVDIVLQLMRYGKLNETNIGQVMADFYLTIQKGVPHYGELQLFANQVVLKLMQQGKLNEKNVGQVMADFYLEIQKGVSVRNVNETGKTTDKMASQVLEKEEKLPVPSQRIKNSRVVEFLNKETGNNMLLFRQNSAPPEIKRSHAKSDHADVLPDRTSLTIKSYA